MIATSRNGKIIKGQHGSIVVAPPKPRDCFGPGALATTSPLRLRRGVGRYEVGVYQTTFDGNRLASGMYLVKATVQPETGGASLAFTQRLTLLK